MTGQIVARCNAMSAHPMRTPVHLSNRERLGSAVRQYFRPMWRFLRRLGLCAADADDAAQDVMMVVARKLDEIEPGREKAFMFRAALHMALRIRRSHGRRHEVGDDVLEGMADEAPAPDDLSDRIRLRQQLDRLLDALPFEQRAVFVLVEIDGLTVAEVAELLEIPAGTAASRLRRAREAFDQQLGRLHAWLAFRGGEP